MLSCFFQDNRIPVPSHIIINRDGLPEGKDPEGFVETEDYVEFDGSNSLTFSPRTL